MALWGFFPYKKFFEAGVNLPGSRIFGVDQVQSSTLARGSWGMRMLEWFVMLCSASLQATSKKLVKTHREAAGSRALSGQSSSRSPLPSVPFPFGTSSSAVRWCCININLAAADFIRLGWFRRRSHKAAPGGDPPFLPQVSEEGLFCSTRAVSSAWQVRDGDSPIPSRCCCIPQLSSKLFIFWMLGVKNNFSILLSFYFRKNVRRFLCEYGCLHKPAGWGGL